MRTESEALWREDFSEALGLFEEWRSARQRGARIPESLWRPALALAGRHGVARTATTLKLDYYVLKKRLHPEMVDCVRRPKKAEGRARFVEISSATLEVASKCTVEFDGGNGTPKVRVLLEGAGIGEVGALIRAVCAGRKT